MPSLRHQRVRELLKRELGEVVRREIPPQEFGIVTVNDVGVSGDLRSATVFIGVVGSPSQRQQALAWLLQQRPRLQQLLSRAVVLKHTPRLRFVLDDAIERGNRVLTILDELERTPPNP